jgi:hypothetical protein
MSEWTPKINALVAGVLVTIGFTMVWNPIPATWAAAAGVGFTALLVFLGTTPRHVWAWACLFLGLESLSWPAVQMIKLRMSGVVEPNEEQMQDLVGTMFLGIFFATFWLTFAYGVFRWIKRREQATEPPDEPPPLA